MISSAIVIGAGVAGLATAALLGKEGYSVTVVDRLDTVGGRAGELVVDGFRFDTGPSWYLMPGAFDHFFALLGKRTDDVLDLVPLNPGYRLFPEDEEPLDVPSTREEAIALFESIEPGAGAQLREYLKSAEDTYEIAVEKFLYTTFSSYLPFFSADVRARYQKLAEFLVRPLDAFVDKRFCDVRLKQMLTYPAVFLSSHPSRTPSMYHLMSHTDLSLGVKYPQGGFAAVVDAIAQCAREEGATLQLGCDVTAIRTDPRTRLATGVSVRTADGEVVDLDADVVVSTADLKFTETRLLPPDARTYDEKYFASRDPGIGTVLVMLGVEGTLPQLDHHNLLFSRDWGPDFDAVFDGPIAARPTGASRSVYVSKPSATDPSTAPCGNENLFILVPTPAAIDLGHGDAYREAASPAVDAIADAAIEQIAQWCDIPDLPQRIVVRKTLGPADFAGRYNAWSGGSIGPAHTLKQSAFFRGRNQSKKLSNLYYAGATTLPGVGVPMCLISAENVVKRLRGDRSPGPLAEPI
ncbi:phytoene desaturase family protein [Corynebacterium aquatimens]|uniref:Phytoene desaturase n=1 Tax=Corynebacterium aquatimens TaxID=1190508 RepID=A0A931GR21_9CORY|nr:phytoene desaturase family protein [Corynebacterium aquatimens]MBG6121468.1 phytoene desaturase [Corynebacterium aquatimens]WJY65988.1 Dehydrosqualene desaturase [Corynebacterium aquatimens]